MMLASFTRPQQAFSLYAALHCTTEEHSATIIFQIDLVLRELWEVLNVTMPCQEVRFTAGIDAPSFASTGIRKQHSLPSPMLKACDHVAFASRAPSHCFHFLFLLNTQNCSSSGSRVYSVWDDLSFTCHNLWPC